MPTLIDDKKVFSLVEVCQSIRATLEKRYSSTFWVSAEMNKLNYFVHSGHCYPELLDRVNGRVVAEMRSLLWKADYERINAKFVQVLEEPLKDGIKILMSVSIQFDAKYGLSLRIHDIDPSYTLGELQREKMESIRQLQALGIFTQNQSLPIALLPQRIAIISVETSKGYSDFLKVIDQNNYGFQFFHMLFPALLQGDNSVPSILNQLDRIEKVKSHFDLVAIIRGGGGDVGLSSYNNFDLAKRIAEFPLPVLTGIGHSTNITVSEMVSHFHGITPTEIGEWLIDKFVTFASPIVYLEKLLESFPKQLLGKEKMTLLQSSKYLDALVRGKISRQENLLENFQKQLPDLVKNRMSFEKRELLYCSNTLLQTQKRMMQMAQNDLQYCQVRLKQVVLQSFQLLKLQLANKIRLIHAHQPEEILKKGFSITYLNQNVVRKVTDVNSGDTIKTTLSDGNSILSIIK